MKEPPINNAEYGEPQYYYRLDQFESRPFQPAVSTSTGAVIKGEYIYVGLVTKARGTGSQPHRHPFEQFNYVLKGTVKARVGGKEQLVSAGGLIHIPRNTLHSIVTTTDEDAVYLMMKNVTPFGMDGIPEDETAKGPRYENGFEPK
jgi:quercetin dioxygenase-like cupin family protein